MLIYNLLLPLGLLVMAPGALRKMLLRGGRASDLRQRLGFFKREQIEALQTLQSRGDVSWIHAVSVGEVGIAAKLVRELLAHQPGLRFVLTSTTPTGCTLAEKLSQDLPGTVVALYSPVDTRSTVRRFLQAIRPKGLVLVEAEVWPNLVFAASSEGIPITLVNARLSMRSQRRFRALRFLARPIYGMLDRVCVQEPEDTARFAITFGIPPEKLVCTGSIKFDTIGDSEPSEQVAELREHVAGLGWDDDPILLAASTHAGEELALARIFAPLKTALPSLRLILVPRHMERSAEIIQELAQVSLVPVRRTQLRVAGSVSPFRYPATSVLLVDTTGELRAWQHLATVVVIGKSFLAKGGQNPAEASVACKPVVFGPHMENFESVVRLLLKKNGAVQVENFAALEPTLLRLLADEDECRSIGLNGRDALQAHDGSTRRTAELLLAEER